MTQPLSGAYDALGISHALSCIILMSVCKVGTTILSPHFLNEETEAKQVALNHKASR